MRLVSIAILLTLASAMVSLPAASDGSPDSPFEVLSGAVTAANTGTVQRCAVAPVNLPGKTYNVRVIQ